jgi:hypothetical protein
MPSFEAVVDTSRAERYVEQFTNHFAHRPGGMGATPGDGTLLIDLGGGTCRMQVDPRGLVLRVESADPSRLDEIKQRIAERVEQVGRREGLVVRWQAAA